MERALMGEEEGQAGAGETEAVGAGRSRILYKILYVKACTSGGRGRAIG